MRKALEQRLTGCKQCTGVYYCQWLQNKTMQTWLSKLREV